MLPPEYASRATEVDPGLWLIAGPRRFPSSNSLLLHGGGETVLVDAGLEPELLRALAPRVDRVVLTHLHVDHVLGANEFPREKLWMNEVEAAAMEVPESTADYLGVRDPAVRDEFIPYLHLVGYPFGRFENVYKPSGELELAGRRFRLVPLPGHSPGHHGMYDPRSRVLFSVDVEFSGLGPWYAWPHCDPGLFERSIREARPLFAEARVVLTSHSRPLTENVLPTLDEFLAHFDARDQQVLDALTAAQRPLALDALVDRARVFYGKALDRDPSDPFTRLIRYWSGVMTVHHLERLAARGLVRWDGRVASAQA